MKTGKEVKIEDFKNYNIIFGSVNNKHPKAVYINFSAWADPQIEEDVNYTRVIREMNKKLKQLLFNLFDSDKETEFLKERTIVDLDIRESGIKFKKRSFMNCEVTLFLNSEIPVNSEMMRNILIDITGTIIKLAFDDNKYFKFYKSKK